MYFPTNSVELFDINKYEPYIELKYEEPISIGRKKQEEAELVAYA